MPTRAPSVCGHCNKAHPRGETCKGVKTLQRERKARHDLKRPSARKRGYDSEWAREAKAFLSLPQNEFCQCGQKATVVMHVKSIRQRPDLRMVRSNWKPGCQRCNAIDAANERRTLERNKP
ncbi:endonuclease [uncultured Agrobacterium sp.]|uniref:endonuclease n=1 Tax=uncultured Agrobacterium sp. TaxID=157277 RepID=UPI00258A98FD|nr:endonuclease [uncultured Agrobacterium sp.]